MLAGIERSMPPPIMTNDMPTAMIPSAEVWTRMLMRLLRRKKVGAFQNITPSSTTPMARGRSSSALR